ncbi:hypothetical protein Ciccas_005224 [Cichlidogyrus casuarinus]|uniref:Uncharacterized protein n=1 Tax=Cichlidogyrus casuarinus TaxID=1844966 RepID=A0ABD2Q9B7_9PLAT
MVGHVCFHVTVPLYSTLGQEAMAQSTMNKTILRFSQNDGVHLHGRGKDRGAAESSARKE